MASPIENLPHELLYKICEHLGQESQDVNGRHKSGDIPIFRQTCRLFAAIGLELLMQTIHFVTTEESLSRLQLISEDSHLAPLVRTLVWEVHKLPYYDSTEEWIRSATLEDLARDGGSSTDQFGTAEGGIFQVHQHGDVVYGTFLAPMHLALAAWHRYCKIFAFQQLTGIHFFQLLGENFRLEECLLAFTNLDSFHFRMDSPVGLRGWRGPSCHNRYKETMLAPAWSDYNVNYGALEMHALLDATMVAKKPLKEIKSDQLSYRFFSLLRYRKEHSSQPNAFTDQISNLRKLQLVICLDEGSENNGQNSVFTGIDSTEGGIGIRAGLVEFLERLPDLNTLSLHFEHQASRLCLPHNKEGIPPAGLHLTEVLGPIRWRNLRVLSLSWIRTDRKSLSLVLMRHAVTLESLCLSKIHLIDGNWKALFDRIHKLQFNEVRYSRWFSSEDPQEIFHVNATIKKGEGIQFTTPGLAFGAVQLFTPHTLGRLLTGQKYEYDDETTACVDYWLRGDGRMRLETYWNIVDKGLWPESESVEDGHFRIDARGPYASQGQGNSLRFGRYIENLEWKWPYYQERGVEDEGY